MNQNENPTELFFTLGGLFGTSYEIQWSDGYLLYLQRPPGGEINREELRPAPADWGRFWRQLTAIGIWDWEGEYDDFSAREGTSWALEIKYKDQKVICSGINAYPPQGKGPSMSPAFRRFLRALSELVSDRPLS